VKLGCESEAELFIYPEWTAAQDAKQTIKRNEKKANDKFLFIWFLIKVKQLYNICCALKTLLIKKQSLRRRIFTFEFHKEMKRC
jgi:hypothetical protein